MHPYKLDEDPSEISDGLPSAINDELRIRKPHVRKGWLNKNKSILRGSDSYITVSWEDIIEILAKELSRIKEKYGNKSFFPVHEIHAQEEEILESFLFQFYADKDAPPKILINLDQKKFKNVEKILNQKNNKKVLILKPLVGEKFKHVKLAEKNAKENIKLKKASLANHLQALSKLKEFL